MKAGFIIACHNKIDDLMAHLEIFKYCPLEHEVIVVHTMDYADNYMQEIKKHHHQRIDGMGHYIGPLLCAVAGVRKAHELGLDYAVYRNADDWLFNYKFEEDNFKKMKSKGYLCAGYNWLNVGVFHDITLNQVYFDVKAFEKTADDAESYFKRSQPGFLCEYKMSRWVRRTLPTNIERYFYRLPGREQEPGIGHERRDLWNAFKAKGMQIPLGFWERLENNNRFFNLDWQMIGSHDVGSRLSYWRKIRSLVSYGKSIEKETHFARFIEAARNNDPWNVKVKSLPPPPVAPPTKQPKLIRRKIF
jgi:hypothetical protein